MLRNFNMIEVGKVNRDVGETSAVGFYGPLQKARYSARYCMPLI